jgi:hypothetical protein
MFKSFNDMINEAVMEGYTMGIQLFMETLEQELTKQDLYEQFEPEQVVKSLFIEASIPTDGLNTSLMYESEDDGSYDDDIDEDKLDRLLDALDDEDND